MSSKGKQQWPMPMLRKLNGKSSVQWCWKSQRSEAIKSSYLGVVCAKNIFPHCLECYAKPVHHRGQLSILRLIKVKESSEKRYSCSKRLGKSKLRLRVSGALWSPWRVPAVAGRALLCPATQAFQCFAQLARPSKSSSRVFTVSRHLMQVHTHCS